MKAINLPATNTIAFGIDPSFLSLDGGQISLGSVGPEEIKELEIARENGAKIIWSTTCLEKTIDSLIVDYFMGAPDGISAKRHLFTSEIIQSSSISFSLKKHLIEKISNEVGALKGKDKSRLQSCLKSVMRWRNAFAHGEMRYVANKGAYISYYEGSCKEEQLNDVYWSSVEATFEKCQNLVKVVESEIRKNA